MSIEKDVVSQAINGDKNAFAQIYEVYFDKIYRYIYLRLGNQTEAEDLTQEVFASSLEAIGSYKWRNLPFASWLFRIAHNKVIDHLRKEHKVEKIALEDDMCSIDERNPEFIAQHNLDVEELFDNVKKLSPAQHAVISLRFGSELSIAEVAKVLGKSAGTVKALQYSGVRALRRMLPEER